MRGSAVPDDAATFLDTVSKMRLYRPAGNLGTPGRLRLYLERLFEGVDLRDATVLDVGAGSGLATFWAVRNGARHVVALEPEVAGSSTGMNDTFARLKEVLKADNAEVLHKRLDEYDPAGAQFDLVLIHNTVNHLDEDACRKLPDAGAAATYRAIFQHCRRLVKPTGRLIVADCGRRNVFGDLGARSPLAPSIDWSVHQQPEVWERILTECGFARERLSWTSLGALGGPGAYLCNNRIAAYLTLSHFVLVMRPVGADPATG